MNALDGNDLLNSLTSTTYIEFKDYIFDIRTPLNIDINKITLKNTYKNCIFTGDRIDFLNLKIDDIEKESHILIFENCEFNNEIYFKDCSFQEITFRNSLNIEKIHIACKKLSYLILNNEEKIECKNFNLTLHNINISKELTIRNIKTENSYLDFLRCEFNNVEIFNNNLKRIDISNSTCKKTFDFNKNEISDSYIKDNNFFKFSFTRNDLNGESNFRNNDFIGTTLFEKNKNDIRGKIIITSCNFEKYTYFSNSNLYELKIDTSKFLETTSFQDFKIDIFNLDRTIFEKTPFFDDFSIEKIDRCTHRTIRNLKQQLLRADNSIDYNFYRAIEHRQYKIYLKDRIKKSKTKTEKKRLKRDLTILRINDFYSDNGVNWVKAIIQTLLLASIFYILFFIVYNLENDFDLQKINEFLIGYFRFFLVTDYYNPLEDRKYIDIWYAWPFFIIGKIAIGIGIFEIINSFRKFKK
ncbi:hypothetical protein AR438_14160 [Chryseobacterium aquaticum]|uniref:Uncharacterized protein n=1 Tax=Chryseobacterium aquaticum TaxID=452084 RepID=A0A0Q3K4T7_9FLAO|nr:hypothetical protein [Chryseobacterium aquaticum]KQK24827.1 hypothetical protein AR438_14160 [Chryseobacterium aquaticum]